MFDEYPKEPTTISLERTQASQEIADWFNDRLSFTEQTIDFLTERHAGDDYIEFAQKIEGLLQSLTPPRENRSKKELNPKAIVNEFSERIARTEHDVGGLTHISFSALKALQENKDKTYLPFLLRPENLSKLKVARNLLFHHWFRLRGEEEQANWVNLKDFSKDISQCFEAKGLKVSVSTTVAECQLRVCELTCLLFNLLQNACRNQRKNRDQDAGATVSLVRQKEGKELLIQVIDQGVGLSADGIVELLKRYQGEMELDKKAYAMGHGIGSLNVGEIVKRVNGKATVKSKEGVGTIVKITIPLP